MKIEKSSMKHFTGLLEGHWDGYLNLFEMFDRAGIPHDSRWRSLLLYLREIKDYTHLSDAQKANVQGLLTSALEEQNFTDERLNKILKDYQEIVVKPYKVKVDALVREAADVIGGFQRILTTRCGDLSSLEEESVSIISSDGLDSIESINKLRNAFSKVKTRLEEDIRNLEQLATRDGITNIANRRGFDLFMDNAIRKWLSEKRPLCLALLDIDHFKRFNDEHGHRIGDQVLAVVGAHLKKVLREFEEGNNVLAARYGGEEFALVISGQDADKLAAATEKCRNLIKNFNFLIRDADGNVVESGLHITVSAGVATLWENWQNAHLENLIDSADKALYFAKQSGRDKAFAFCPGSEQGFSLLTVN
ncbi:MAG: hypothetical protein DELT_00422 [Desulfovibrio sp.]